MSTMDQEICDERNPVDVEHRSPIIRTSQAVAAVIPIQALGLAVCEAAASAPPASPSAGSAPGSVSVVPDGYQFFSAEEAAFVEAAVSTMCPCRRATPDGVACGLATYIDRQLGVASAPVSVSTCKPWHAGKPEQGYQLPFDPAGFFRAGLQQRRQHAKPATARTRTTHAPAARCFPHRLGPGQGHRSQRSTRAMVHELVFPLFEQACFAARSTGGNRDKVFGAWSLSGAAGIPHSRVQNFRGKPSRERSNPTFDPGLQLDKEIPMARELPRRTVVMIGGGMNWRWRGGHSSHKAWTCSCWSGGRPRPHRRR